jgi:TorA maturation chaperone TorD
MELLRTLGGLLSSPDATVSRLATALELPASPTPAEYAFVFQSQLRPYASIYLSADGEPGGEARDRIAGFWRAVSDTPPPEPDHLGSMLTFYAGLLEREDRESDEALRHAVARIRKAFLWEQLLTWLPGYTTKIDLLAPQPYRRWAQLLEQAISRETWRAGAVASVPATLQRLQEGGDPATGDIDALVRYLTAPARSGLILAPLDLERAADELHVPTPTGDVRSGLCALAAIRLNALLNWAAAEAHRWEQRHERSRDLLPALTDHWMRRARATRALLMAWIRGHDAAHAEMAGSGAGRPAASPRHGRARPRAGPSHRHS